VVKSRELNDITQDYSSFQGHFKKSQDNLVVSFPSFSGDTLIVPVPKKDSDAPCSYGDRVVDYKNISKFSDNALVEQWEAL